MASFSLNRADGTQMPHVHDHQPGQRNQPSSRFVSSGSSRSPRASQHAIRGGAISPPPLKRTSIGASNRLDSSPAASSFHGTPSNAVPSPMARLSGLGVGAANSPQSSAARGTPKNGAPQAEASSTGGWTVAKIADRLTAARQDVKDGHVKLASFVIESTTTTERRIHHGRDAFANIATQPVVEKGPDATRIKFKQHLKAKKDQREGYYKAICIKSIKDRVPRYRFHHVEIKKNVLTPNTMLTFVPHLRDLETSEESKYNLWLKELEDFDLKSGFKPMNREEKSARTVQSERARTVSLYLESWLDRLAIPGCNKSTLIRYMARQESEETITPQQKTDIVNSHNPDDDNPGADDAAEMFTKAFGQVFTHQQPASKQINLRDVLFLDESVDNILDSKPTTKEAPSSQAENEYDVAEGHLASYCILGCLICFSHSCEHGEYDNQNCKHTFSLSSSRHHIRDLLESRQALSGDGEGRANGNGISAPPCRRRCYRSTISYESDPGARPFSEMELGMLRAFYATADRSKVKRDSICLVADILNRDCFAVHYEFEKLGISLPRVEPKELPRVKNLPWFDRYKKVLLGDWQDHTVTHEYQRREFGEPCFHEGPCNRSCSCVRAGILCEKFCGCSVENCAYKFTGCSCHSQGKTCQRKPNDKSSCICIQLNRECDPAQCGSCGAFERADPENADDTVLHSTGCQNCTLQRGASKALLLGQSQLEGVGYGLFTAQDIAQDEFVVEYVGELIFHDEGVRREARRGDVFDEDSTISYLFTLLENDGIWVDAAIYGNLSRYINHAPESEKRGCNITPRILYVNGEFRIKFTALRDIKAGEELFFNYGDEFPNLTKKLLDEKAGENSAASKRKAKRPNHATRDDRVARKAPKAEPKKPAKAKRPRKEVAMDVDDEDVVMEDEDTRGMPAGRTESRKRKRSALDDSDGDEYRPGRTGVTKEVSESAVGPEQPSPSTPSRLRARARSSKTRAGGSQTPSKGPTPLKPKGKRGGARPGSGRPRKHPRPVPKRSAASPSGLASAGSVANADTPVAAASSAPTTPARASPRRQPQQHQEQQQSQGSRRRTSPSVVEISDSDEEESPKGSMEQSFEDDDTEDQDVVVRKRVDRASRNRRPPAKFRNDQPWT